VIDLEEYSVRSHVALVVVSFLMMWCALAVGVGGAQVVEKVSPKTADDFKMLRMPAPGERTLIRVDPTMHPLKLSEIILDPSAPEAALVPLFEDEVLSNAVPVNDNCANATLVIGTGSFAYNTSEATTDGLAHPACNFFGQSQIERDVWFRWRAPATAIFVADTCTGTSVDTKLAVYTNTTCPPGNGAVLGCNDDACSVQSRVTFNAVNGQDYLIRVGVYPGKPGGTGTLRVLYQSGQILCTYPAANCQPRNNADAYFANGPAVADDFTPKNNGFISGLCFYGTYFNGLTGCTATDQFTITYYDNLAGSPGTEIRRFVPGQYTKTGPVATGQVINGSLPEYGYTITHAGVQVFADQCYWVEIVNNLPSPPQGDCAWYWEKGNNGNSIAFQGMTRIDTDLAFCINLQLDPATECQTDDAPPNDSCSGAIPVFCNSGISSEVNDNLFATTAVTDPDFTCRIEGSDQGVGTMWYRFTPSQTSARISVCGNTSGDTLLALYSGTCSNLTQIACDDDACGLRSQFCATGLTPGQQYYIQFATFDEASRGPYQISVTCPCPPPPANDVCAGAIALSIPGFVSSSNINATTDSGVPTCGLSLVSGPGVWYRVTGNGTTLRASLCNATAMGFDTKLSVFCGTCPQLVCVAQNDDECGVLSEVEWCSTNGLTYYILVHGFAGNIGTFAMEVTSNSIPCSGAVPCTTCELTCPVGAIAEFEPCGADENGGCNVFPNAVQSIACGTTICGTMRTIGTQRDTDWYEFTLTAPSVVTWSVQSEHPIECYLLDTDCPATILAGGAADRCGTAVATALLQPGTYRTFVGASGDGYPCGNSNDYIAQLICGAVGACCVGNDCFRVTEEDCETMLGFYAGDSTSCPVTYIASTCANSFEDIQATGLPILLQGDEGISVPIGFSYRFYGVTYNAIGVSSNGYLSFDASLGESQNAVIPSVAVPNALIAPLWDDLSPEAGGVMHYQTLGSAPNRRFIAQWKNVPQFLMTDSNTFQAVLYESTGCIEFRYGLFTPQAFAGDYSVGVENQSGSSGTSIDASTLSQGSCVRLCPSLNAGGCQAIVPCPGDANGDNVVNFQDITSVLFYWGTSGPPGDANNDGIVSFPDMTSVLFNWNNVCNP